MAGQALQLQGRTALITGAGRGIGRAVALGFARAGAQVACAARTTDQVQAVAAEIAAAGGSALALTCDVTDVSQVEAMCAQTVTGWGGLDILVINAGVEMAKSTVDDSDPALWAQVIQTNLIGAYHCARAAVSLSAGSGRRQDYRGGIRHGTPRSRPIFGLLLLQGWPVDADAGTGAGGVGCRHCCQ